LRLLITRPLNHPIILNKESTLVKMLAQILVVIFLFFSTVINAQVKLYGKLSPSAKNTEIKLTNFDGIKISITVNADNTFIFKSDSLQQGFYNIDEIGTVYLSEGYNLKIAPAKKKGEYLFTGKGALENNSFINAKKAISNFLPRDNKNEIYGGLAQSVYYTEPSYFLQKINDYKNYCTTLFNISKDTFFKKYASLDLDYFIKPIFFSYYAYYGKDIKLLKQAMVLLSKANATNTIATANKYMELEERAITKKLSDTCRLNLSKILYANWNKNDETLFKNSKNYRAALNDFLSLARSNVKYLKMPILNLEDIFVKDLAIANNEIINPYILNYFNYSISTNIINTTKDTAVANKYYQQFLAKNTKQDYVKEITQLYNNKILYSNGMPTPLFTFNNISNKPLALQSLLGKYVYIDVWATWCGPCKAEIPHLQKLEVAYKTKNIQFVSISVDEQKDAAKWKNYVTKKKLGGLQLMADSAFESTFIKNMGISSIPRFILIDPEGKLVAANALRPSDAELRKMLDKLL
jgi:thiol-disulfide isomerase/thioredoxin